MTTSLAGSPLLLGHDRARATETGEPTWRKLPRWRGFNLLEKFYRNEPFRERDFQWMADWGFDFVRLPLDYQQWTDANDPQRFDERVLGDIDQAVAWGRKYGIHVCLNLHNAPGYTVNAAVRHDKSLWHDTEMQQQFAGQWKQFARRYRGEPPSRVSFNLVNEPHTVDADAYVSAIRGAVEAIRAEDPARVVISDGLGWGRMPLTQSKALQIAQSLRGYEPMWLTHYRASWVQGSDEWPAPTWPAPLVQARLYGPGHADWHRPLSIEGPWIRAMELRVRIGQVSRYAKLRLAADGEPIFERIWEPGPGKGEWSREIYSQQWNIYQNLYDRDYTATVPAGTKQLTLQLSGGDWLTINELGLRPVGGKREDVLVLRGRDWGRVQETPIRHLGLDAPGAFVADDMLDKAYLARGLEPWRELAAGGVGVHVGEWGAFRHTPHQVVLRWAEQLLELWAAAGFGWAMWNLRGGFGVVDSERTDVAYASHQGHQLDTRLLKLLQRY